MVSSYNTEAMRWMDKITWVIFSNVIGTGIILWRDQTQTCISEPEVQVYRQVRQFSRQMPSNVWSISVWTGITEIMNFRTKRSGSHAFLSRHFALGDRNLVRFGKAAENTNKGKILTWLKRTLPIISERMKPHLSKNICLLISVMEISNLNSCLQTMEFLYTLVMGKQRSQNSY